MSRIFRVSGIGTKIKAIIQKVKGKIDNVVKKLMDKVAGMVAKIAGAVTGKGKTDPNATKANEGPAKTPISGEFGREDFTAGKEPHAVWLKMNQSMATVMIASTPLPAKTQLDGWRNEATQKNLQAQVGPYIGQAMTIVNRAVKNLNKTASSATTVDKVTIEEMWKNDAKALARVVKVIRDGLWPEVNYAFVTDSSGVKRTKLIQISFLCPKALSQAGFRGEFSRQIEGQQEGLNKLGVPQWFTNRTGFLNKGRSNKEQSIYRTANKVPWVNAKTLEVQSRPYNRELLLQLKRVLSESEIRDLQDLTQNPIIAAAEARSIANAIWAKQAALHDPDQNAGGFSSGLTGVGDRDVNSSIGSQWKERVYLIDREVAKVPEILRPDLKINTRLRSQ
jgi:hypothetical protein